MEFPTNAVLLALSFIGVGSLAYLLFWKEEEETTKVISKQGFEIEVKVPKDCVGIVIGRQGANIKHIESSSGSKINFFDIKNDSDFRICRIRGNEENVRMAELLIHDIIANQPLIETYEMTIPSTASKRVVGKSGETIRNICCTSNAKITLSQPVPGDYERNVVIKGTSEQIAMARRLISEKVLEEQIYQSRMEQSLGSRSPRHAPKFLLAGPVDGEASSAPSREKLIPTGSDGLLEVYASAIESPFRLWLQVKGPATVELDRLNFNMTEYYKKPENREVHALTETRVGQLVAAPFMYDDQYYRAQVTALTTTDSGHDLELYYVDYGDSGVCLQTHAFDLRTDYLKLRFQAIECILAKVKPRGDTWTDEAIDFLEELTHVALWKPLTAKIHSYRERPTRASREGSPVPCVDLYDTSGAEEINIAEQLVTKGFAEWHKDTDNSDTPTDKISLIEDIISVELQEGTQ